MFAESINPMCEAFMNSAERIIKAHGQDILKQEIEVREWDDAWKCGLSEGTHILQNIYDNACYKMSHTMSQSLSDQIMMINTSVFEKHDGEFTGLHYSRFMYFASQLLTSDDDEANFAALPQPLWPRPPGFTGPPSLDDLD
jgi:hypothetical protein